MRRLAIATALFTVVLSAHEGLADPDPPLQRGNTTPPSPVHVAAFKLILPQPPPSTNPLVRQAVTMYGGGPFDLRVDVVNDTNTAYGDATLHVASYDGLDLTQTAPGPVNASGAKSFTFHDPKGVTSACRTKEYRVDVKSAAGMDGTIGEVIGNCQVLSTKIEDPWNQAEPDRVADAQKSSVYLTNATIEKATCGDGLKLKVTVINHSKISAASLIVQGKDAATGRVVTQADAAFPLAPGAAKTIELTPPKRYEDLPDRVDLAIVDWTKQLGGSVQNQGVRVVTTKACALVADIQPPARRVMAPAK